MKINGRHCIVDFLSETQKRCIYYPESGEIALSKGRLDPGDVIESNLTGALSHYASMKLPIKGFTGIIPDGTGGHIYIEGLHVFTITNEICKAMNEYKAQTMTIVCALLTVTVRPAYLSATVVAGGVTYTLSEDNLFGTTTSRI